VKHQASSRDLHKHYHSLELLENFLHRYLDTVSPVDIRHEKRAFHDTAKLYPQHFIRGTWLDAVLPVPLRFSAEDRGPTLISQHIPVHF
jgi:hypothetical protein